MSRYRHGVLELILDPHVIDKYAQEDLLSYYYNMRTSERVLVLKEQLIEEIHTMVEFSLTPRQRQIFDLYLQGMKQEDIGRTLHIIQEGVSLQLNGIPDYRRGGKIYGGILPKLRRLCKKNKRIQQILLEIRMCRDIQ